MPPKKNKQQKKKTPPLPFNKPPVDDAEEQELEQLFNTDLNNNNNVQVQVEVESADSVI